MVTILSSSLLHYRGDYSSFIYCLFYVYPYLDELKTKATYYMVNTGIAGNSSDGYLRLV